MSNDSLIEIIEVVPSAATPSPTPTNANPTGANPATPGAAPQDARPTQTSDPLPDSDTVFRLRPDAKSQIRSTRLPSRCWELLYRIDGNRNLLQIATMLEEPPLQVARDCQRLLCQGLLVESDAISFDEYRGRRSKRPTQQPAVTDVKPTLDNLPGDAEVALKSPASQVDAIVEHAKFLPALMKVVRESRGGGRRGDLAVYLMFTRVPSELFRDAGLRSFLYIDESTELRHKGLNRRLMKEAELILGHALGDKLWTQLGGSQQPAN